MLKITLFVLCVFALIACDHRATPVQADASTSDAWLSPDMGITPDHRSVKPDSRPPSCQLVENIEISFPNVQTEGWPVELVAFAASRSSYLASFVKGTDGSNSAWLFDDKGTVLKSDFALPHTSPGGGLVLNIVGSVASDSFLVSVLKYGTNAAAWLSRVDSKTGVTTDSKELLLPTWAFSTGTSSPAGEMVGYSLTSWDGAQENTVYRIFPVKNGTAEILDSPAANYGFELPNTPCAPIRAIAKDEATGQVAAAVSWYEPGAKAARLGVYLVKPGAKPQGIELQKPFPVTEKQCGLPYIVMRAFTVSGQFVIMWRNHVLGKNYLSFVPTTGPYVGGAVKEVELPSDVVDIISTKNGYATALYNPIALYVGLQLFDKNMKAGQKFTLQSGVGGANVLPIVASTDYDSHFGIAWADGSYTGWVAFFKNKCY